jgi:hypothetical protein
MGDLSRFVFCAFSWLEDGDIFGNITITDGVRKKKQRAEVLPDLCVLH